MDAQAQSGYPSPSAGCITTRNAPVAQLDRVLPSEGRGRAFESRRARHAYNGSVFADWPVFICVRLPTSAGGMVSVRGARACPRRRDPRLRPTRVSSQGLPQRSIGSGGRQARKPEAARGGNAGGDRGEHDGMACRAGARGQPDQQRRHRVQLEVDRHVPDASRQRLDADDVLQQQCVREQLTDRGRTGQAGVIDQGAGNRGADDADQQAAMQGSASRR